MISKFIYGIFITLTLGSCNQLPKSECRVSTKEILYGIEDSAVNRLVIDSILRKDFAKVTNCKIDYYYDTTRIIFFYEDDDYSPWTNEMITRTNRFLKAGHIKIPIIFDSDFEFVIEDSTMSGKARLKTYNWFNNAELILNHNEKLIGYKNYYMDGGRRISEEGRRKYGK